jgi:hypothetical protein
MKKRKAKGRNYGPEFTRATLRLRVRENLQAEEELPTVRYPAMPLQAP